MNRRDDAPAEDALEAAFGVERAWTLVEEFPRRSSDGQPVRLLVCHLPATFYRVEALPTGDKPGFVLATGSGVAMERLALAMAEAISEGLLGLATSAM